MGMLVTAMLIFAIALIGFAATDIFWFACICTAIAGLSVVTIGVSEQTLLQASVDSAMRGRVLSMYSIIARGFPSIGALVMGYIASFTGLRAPVMGGAVLCLLVWLWARRRQARMAEILEAPPQQG